VVVCRGPECGERRGSATLAERFRGEAQRLGPDVERHMELAYQACFGRCRQGPNVLVRLAPTAPSRLLLATAPSGPGQNAALYGGVTEDDVVKILQSHVARGIIVRELVRRPEEVVDPKGGPSDLESGSDTSKPLPPQTPTNSGDSGER